MNWEAITALSTLVSTIIILITAIFAVLQLNEMRRTRKIELFARLFDNLSSPKMREYRKFIYSDLPGDLSELTTEHFLIIDEVLAGLDRTYLLIKNDATESEFVFESYGVIFLRLWKVLHPIVMYERTRRGDYYRNYAEKLVKETEVYFLNNSRPLDYPIYKG